MGNGKNNTSGPMFGAKNIPSPYVVRNGLPILYI